MSRTCGRPNVADVHWVHKQVAGPGRIRQPVDRVHICRVQALSRVRHVHPALNRHGRCVAIAWLDDEQRRLIMPLALWDVATQIDAASVLFSREAAR